MALINLNQSTDYSYNHRSTNHEEQEQEQESVLQYCEYCVLKRMNPMIQCHCQTVSCLATNNVLGPVTVLQDLVDANNSNSSSNNSKQRQNPQSESVLTATTSNSNGNSSNNSDGFVGSELRLMKNLILLSFTSSIALGIVQTLITIDRYIYGPWTYIGFSVAFMLSALSVYYAQAFVTRFGPNKTLTLSTASIVLFVLVHYSSSFILFQFGAIIFALFMGPFYAAQLEFISTFISNLIYLTATIKRYQEERYQKLLHLLLFCPSRIVGHLIYVIIFILLTSSIDNTTTNNHHPQQQLQQQHQQQQRHHHQQQQQQQPNHSKVANYYYNEHQISTIKPFCQRIFRQQYCDQALYYVFTFHHRNIKPTLTSSSSSPSSAMFLPSYYYQTFQPNFIMILITVFILLSLMILTMVMFLIQRIEYYQIQDPLERSHLTGSIRNVMFRTFHDNHLRLLLPMAFFIGLEQGFFMSDYNKLYVSCALGLKAIGFIMLTMGFVHLATTLLVHEFIRHIQRPLVLLAGSCCQLAVLVILCLWRPNDDLPLYYVITICWALSNAILETLLLTNILRTFCADEWKYALLTLYSMHHLGFATSMAMSEFVCLYIKLYSLIFLLILALIPMKICELRLAKFQKILGPGSASHL